MQFYEEMLITLTCHLGDGDSHCVKILSVFYNNLDTSDPNDPEVIIKIDISNSFNSPCCENLSNLFGYFEVMST